MVVHYHDAGHYPITRKHGNIRYPIPAFSAEGGHGPAVIKKTIRGAGFQKGDR